MTGVPRVRPSEPELLDVAGLVVAVAGGSPWRSVVRERFGSSRTRGHPIDVHLDVGGGSAAPVQHRAPDSGSADADFWWGDAALTMRWREVWARQAGPTVCVVPPPEADDELDDELDRGEPSEDELDDELDRTDEAVDLLCQYGVAMAAARPDRVVLHAAAVARQDAALVLVGPSGAGKSSLATAAWRGDWSMLADDLVVVRRRAGQLWVRGVRRPPLLPGELLDDELGEWVDDQRGRRELPADVLVDDELPVAGAVLVGHDDGEGRWAPLPAVERVPSLLLGLAVPPVGPVTASHLPMLAALAEAPMTRLDHARDPAVRSARAWELLDQIGRRTGA
ncbi:MAG: hypothetical protein AAFZ07_03120 [Actinomycetota bacterium]